jgi:hypothetical protein
VGDDGHPASEVHAKIPVHAPLVTQAPACDEGPCRPRWWRRRVYSMEDVARVYGLRGGAQQSPPRRAGFRYMVHVIARWRTASMD